MHITSTCMHARSGHCAGQVYVNTYARSANARNLWLARGQYGNSRQQIVYTLPGTTKRRAQVNYISGKGAFSGESH